MFQKIKPFLLIFLIVWLSYGAMLGMYFWEDDNAIIFKVQNIEGPAGHFGTGVYDSSSAYRGVAALVYPFYLIFGTEPRGYYLVGIIFYFLASLSFYFLAYVLFQKKNLAFWASLIFAAGYIGAESIWRVSTSLQTSHMITAMNISLAFYILSFKSKTKKLLFYFLSLVLFVYTMETGFVRSHGVIFLILGLEVLLHFKWFLSLARVLPFIIAFRFWYQDSRGGEWLGRLTDKIFKEGDLSLLLAPFQQLQNMILPDMLNIPLWLFVGGLGFIFIWKKHSLFWLGIIFMLAHYLVPYITTGGEVFESTDRYITTSIVGFAIFTVILFREVFKSDRKFYLACLVVIVSHIIFNNLAEAKIIQDRGLSSRRFYEQLKKEVPVLPKGSAIYFDVRSDTKSNAQTGAALAVGSMNVTTSIALHYGIDRFDLYLPETFQEALALIRDGKVTPEKFYTFFYDSEKGLTNTTDLTRRALWDESEGKVTFSSPLMLRFRLQSQVDNSKINFTNNNLNLDKYLNYLSSRKSFYKEVSATTSSQWRYHEIQNIADDNLETSWLAHRLKWHYKEKTEIILDLGLVKNIKGVYFTAGHPNKIPTKYSYSCSLNGLNFTAMPHSAKTNKLKVIDNFSPVLCKYFKMEIFDTSAHDEPQIAELEIIETGFEGIDFDLAGRIEENPFDFVASEANKVLIQNYLTNNKYNAKICFETDKYASIDQNCQSLEIQVGGVGDFEVVVPQGGTVLKNIKLLTPPPIKAEMSNIIVRPLTFDELKNRGYIIEYSQN